MRTVTIALLLGWIGLSATSSYANDAQGGGTTKVKYDRPQVSAVWEGWVENYGNDFNSDFFNEGISFDQEVTLTIDFLNDWYLSPTAAYSMTNIPGKDSLNGGSQYITLKKKKVFQDNPWGLDLQVYLRQYSGTPPSLGDKSPKTRFSVSAKGKPAKDLTLGYTLQPQYFWDRPKDSSVRWNTRNILFSNYDISDKFTASLSLWYIYDFLETDPDTDTWLFYPEITWNVSDRVGITPYLLWEMETFSQRDMTVGLLASIGLL